MKASDLLLRCLEAEGVTTIYGVPGEENGDLMMSLLDSPIKFVVCRHEQAAAFMADFHGRLTGRPGVCLSTLGPGATNLVTGVASAQLDHSPLVAIVGQAGTGRLHKESHQNMDSISMFRPITKWASSIRDADTIPETVHKAFKLAAMEKPGATVIELPEDIAKLESDAPPMPSTRHDLRTGISSDKIDQALGLITAAQRPLLLLGNGCVRMRASLAVREFVEKTGIYAANTFMAKGVVSDKSEYSLHCVGLGIKDLVMEAFEQADLVICAGYDLIEWHPQHWNRGTPKKILHIDSLPAEADRFYVPDVEVVGDVAAAFACLASQCGERQQKRVSAFARLREQIGWDLEHYHQDDRFPAKPQRILSELRQVLRDDDILISDVGAHKLWVARQYPAYTPNSCMISNGFCSMGLALPAAIAAKKLHPERQVVALCGDGGFLMNVQDLITAVRYQLPITIFVWEDGEYGMIKWKQEMTYGRSGFVDLVNPDFIRLAESFGCQSLYAADILGLREAFEMARSETLRPTVIVVPVDETENLKLTEHLGELLSH